MNFSNIIFPSSQRVKCRISKITFLKKLLGVITFFYLLFTVYDIFDVVTVVTSDNIVKRNFVEILIHIFLCKK